MANSQNIYTALNHDRKEEIRDKSAKEIIEENTFFNSSGKTVDKNVKKLNDKNRVLVEERFGDDGKLKARLTFDYEPTGTHSLFRKFERWNNGRYSSETAYYDYNESWQLVRVTDKTSQGQVIQVTVLTNNEKGHPVQLQLLDGNGNSYGYEIAEYDYSKNLFYKEVRSNEGKTLSRDTLTIDYNVQTESSTHNEHGDLVKSEGTIREYKYDDFGNWTMLTIYKLEKGKKKRDRIFKRTIKYKE